MCIWLGREVRGWKGGLGDVCAVKGGREGVKYKTGEWEELRKLGLSAVWQE